MGWRRRENSEREKWEEEERVCKDVVLALLPSGNKALLHQV